MSVLRSAAAAGLALALGACATDTGYRGGQAHGGYSQPGHDDYYARCDRCGTVVRIDGNGSRDGTSGAGALAGAVVGGVLGNQVGDGSGRTAATVAGAVIGGVAGNRIERNARDRRFDVHVRLDDGRRVMVSQARLDGLREGSRVLVERGRARLL